MEIIQIEKNRFDEMFDEVRDKLELTKFQLTKDKDLGYNLNPTNVLRAFRYHITVLQDNLKKA